MPDLSEKLKNFPAGLSGIFADPLRERLGCGLLIMGLWAWAILANSWEWSHNEDYAHGWFVPFLCAYFLYQRWQDELFRPLEGQACLHYTLPIRWRGWVKSKAVAIGFLVLLPLLILALELGRQPLNYWRGWNWAIGLTVVATTLAAAYKVWGRQAARAFAFPCLLLLAATPWPDRVMNPITYTLAEWLADSVTATLNFAGIPAMAQGRVIELVGVGEVGVERACSGIRSFQAALLISLVVGELGQFSLIRRGLLVFLSLALTLPINFARTYALSLSAYEQGLDALDRLHDPLAWTAFAVLIGAIAAVAWLLRAKVGSSRHVGNAEGGRDIPDTSAPVSPADTRNSESPATINADQSVYIRRPPYHKGSLRPIGGMVASCIPKGLRDRAQGWEERPTLGNRPPFSSTLKGLSDSDLAQLASADSISQADDDTRRSHRLSAQGGFPIWAAFALSVTAFLLAHGWYAWHEVRARDHAGPMFALQERDKTTPRVSRDSLPERVRGSLRPSEGYYFRVGLQPGSRPAVGYHLFWDGSRSGPQLFIHTPEACMPGIGWKLIDRPEQIALKLAGRSYPWRRFHFARSGTEAHLFWSVWCNQENFAAQVARSRYMPRDLLWPLIRRGISQFPVEIIAVLVYEDSAEAATQQARQLIPALFTPSEEKLK